MKSYLLETEHTEMMRGDIAIYIALVILIIITSSVIILSGILSLQPRATRAVTNSERALYAANTGLEHALFLLTKSELDPNDVEGIVGTVAYDESDAEYTIEGAAIIVRTDTRELCISVIGSYQDETRRLFTGPSSTECGFD